MPLDVTCEAEEGAYYVWLRTLVAVMDGRGMPSRADLDGMHRAALVYAELAARMPVARSESLSEAITAYADVVATVPSRPTETEAFMAIYAAGDRVNDEHDYVQKQCK